MSTLPKAPKKDTDSAPVFVFDANFFIALKEVRASRPYKMLAAAKKKLGLQFYVSAQVFNECPFIVGRDFQEFSDAVEVEMVKDKELDQVKIDLKKRGVRLMAQDPDLTLIAVGVRLKKDKNEVYIVSDDYKLSQNIESLNYRMKGLPLPAFLQFLAKNLTGRQKDYWKIIRKKVLKLNLDYMMSRSSTYAPQAKIAWLIENAVSVAGEGIQLKQNIDEKDEKEYSEKALEEQDEIIKISQKYIMNKTISKDERLKIEPYEGALNQIKKARKYLSDAKFYLMRNNTKESLKHLRKAADQMTQVLQLSGTKYKEAQYQLIEKIFASEIAKITFLHSYILIGANKVASALIYLDQTALFSTMARLMDTVLTINFLKALLYVFNSLYNRAIKQYKFIRELADLRGKEDLKLKAIIGEAITLYLIGNTDDAFDLVSEANESLEKGNVEALMIALLDSGDYFLALGFPEIASNLYAEGLECAIDLEKKWKYSFILNKMKKAYMGSALLSTDVRPSSDISVLIDKFHSLPLSKIGTFNDLMVDLAMFNNKLYQPFEHFTPGVRKLASYYDLPDEFRDEWACVKIQEIPKTGHTLLVGYKEEVGLIGFDVVLDRTLEGVPENYELKIKKSAKFRLEPPKNTIEQSSLIRAVMRVKDEERDLEIIRQIPSFFKELKL